MRASFRLIELLVLSGTTACATGGLISVFSPALSGSLTIEREGEATATIKPTECASGDHGHFLGVDLVDPAGPHLIRVVIDPVTGPVIKLVIGSGANRSTFRVDGGGCVTFGVKVEENGWRINDFRAVVGEAELDCSLPDQSRVKGLLTFRQCH